MVRRILLVLLVGVVAFAVYVSRKRYDVAPFTTPSGRVFQVKKRDPWCPKGAGICLTAVNFETTTLDSAQFRKDAKELAAAFHEESARSKTAGVALYGYRPGRFRLFPPDSGRFVVEMQVARGTWRIVADSAIGKMTWSFGGSGLW